MVRILFLFSILFALFAHAEVLSGTLKKIKDTGSITIGYRESSIPFSYLDDHQKPIGYSMDLCYTIVDAIKSHLQLPKIDVQLIPVTSQTRIPLIVNGTVDLECGSTTNSKARQQQVAFSVTHFITDMRILTKGLKIDSVDDLAGKTVVTTAGTTSDRFLKKLKGERKLAFKSLYGKDHSESFLMLETGRATALVLDDILLAALVATSKNPSEFSFTGPILSEEPYGLMIRRNDPAFKAVADQTLTKLFQSEAMEILYKKWFLSPVPPRNINLNLPMGESLKKAFKQPSDQGV